MLNRNWMGLLGIAAIVAGLCLPASAVEIAKPIALFSHTTAEDTANETINALTDGVVTSNVPFTLWAPWVVPNVPPVHLVFDLVDPYAVTEVEVWPRQITGVLGPRDTDFFYFADDDPTNIQGAIDDIEGDPNIVQLANHEFAALQPNTPGSDTATIAGAPFKRYIGMRFNTGWPTDLSIQITEMSIRGTLLPEPGTLALAVCGMMLLAGRRRR